MAINPYVGCGHSCVYCYARYIKRFTGHDEEWGTFVDARINVADVLKKQLKSPKFQGQRIFVGTVTDPYQPVERDFGLTRKVLEVLINFPNPVSILTKSNVILRDIDLLKKLKNVDINFTINTLDAKWQSLVEPNSSSVNDRLVAARKLVDEGINVFAMMGPYWPVFTSAQDLFKEFKKAGIKQIFTESFNTTGGNWSGVEKVLVENYPDLLSSIKETLFTPRKFFDFYSKSRQEVELLSKKYAIPATIYFGSGHAAKFKS